jgi:hypothetical protein
MRRYAWTALALAAAGALLLAAAAFAGGAPESTTLTGAQEVPSADPDGSGTATLRLNPGNGTICYELTVSNIATATAAHIHAAPAGVNGPVVVPLVPPAGGSSTACTSADRSLVLGILKHPESYYVNVHNAEFPGGAIRGQLSRP